VFSLANEVSQGDRNRLQNQFRKQGMMQLLVGKAWRAVVFVWEAKNKLLEASVLPSFVRFKTCHWDKPVF